tara:strand:- start:1207 stop:2442 length:1236 start_codon:yes stop_codon:yes gene_type:complete
MRESDLRIITNENDIFHIQIYIPIGSIHEEKGEYGISHFLEHLKFNKSEKYDTETFRNKLDEFSYNAYTTLDHTSYFITANNKYYEELINLMKEIVFNTNFSNNEIEIERDIVLSEKIYRKKKKTILDDISIYDKKNPYYRPVIGNTKDLNGLKNTDFKRYNKLYLNDFFVFINCPEKDKSKIQKLCLKKFPKSLKNNIKPLKNTELFNYELSIRNIIDEKQILILRFKSFDSNDKNVHYVDFLNNIISKGKISKLKKLLREEKGIVYRIESFNEKFKHNGYYTIKIILKKNENINKVIKLIFNEIEKLKNNKIHKKDLERFKRIYLNQLNLKLKDNIFNYNFFGVNLFYDREFNIDFYKNQIKNLNSDKLLELFKKILNYYQMNIIIYGNYQNINKKNEQIYKIIEKYRN